LKFLE